MTDEANGVIQESVAEVQEAVQQEQQVSDKELNFKAMRESLEALKRRNDFLEMQMMQQQTPQQEKSEVDLNQFKDDDIPTYGELKRIFQKEQRERQQYMEKIKDIEVKATYKDYNEVIKNYLPDVLQDDPDLAVAIQNNPQMHKLAYKLAQASPRYHQQKLANQNNAAVNKIVENASRPQPANARKNISVQDEEARMSAMTDEQIMGIFNMAKARS